MKAAVKTAAGFDIADVERPAIGKTDLLVKVRAASLNRADLFMVDGRAHGQHGGPGTVLGLEWSGDVVEVGAEVPGYKAGDQVMCSGIGGFAEYAASDWRRTLPFPASSLDYDAAGCLSVAVRTAFVSLSDLGGLEPGQSVLVLGASSAVGLMCLQVAKLLGAGLVIGTSTNEDRRGRLAEFGADVALDSNDRGWVEKVLDRTGESGADLLIDFLAGPLINDGMRAVRLGGRIVNVGRMAGESGHFDFDLHSLRRIQYLGQTFRTRTAQEVGEIGERMRARLWPALGEGKLGLPIDARLPLDRIGEGYEMMRRNAHFGKIVIVQAG